MPFVVPLLDTVYLTVAIECVPGEPSNANGFGEAPRTDDNPADTQTLCGAIFIVFFLKSRTAMFFVVVAFCLTN